MAKNIATLYRYTGAKEIKYMVDSIENRHMRLSDPRYFNDPFDCLKDYDPSTGIEKADDIRILCLTNSYLNKMMWSHYADGHKGICYTLEVDKDIVYPLCYTSKRLDKKRLSDKDYLDSVLQKNKMKPKQNLESKDYSVLPVHKKVALVKDGNWLYEKEYRIVLDKGDTAYFEETEAGMYFLKNVRITNIYLGVSFRCDPVDYKILEETCRRNHVKITKIGLANDYYRLTVIK